MGAVIIGLETTVKRVFRATMVTIVILNVVNVLEMKCVTLIQAIAQEDVEGIGRNLNVMNAKIDSTGTQVIVQGTVVIVRIMEYVIKKQETVLVDVNLTFWVRCVKCVTMDIIINHARSNVGIAWMGNHVTKKTGRAQWVASPITSNLFAR
ncbi:uncharacterized protein LOC144623165 [Crassostrea virginica]